MSPKKAAFAALAEGLIKNLEKRNITGHYFETSEALCTYLKETLPKDAVISWGGSESVKESGVMELLQTGGYSLIDRATAKTPQEAREIFSRTVLSDYYFMSTNAITLDGELINIDGNGNRVAALAQGPAHIYIIAGRNKISSTVEDGVHRVRNIAAPPNVKHLNRQTPCQVTGRCGDCQSPDSICSHLVITRRSFHKDRIHVFLVNEELGY